MEPDLDWYIDHVVAASGPERAPVGAVRSAQAHWTATARALRATGQPDELGAAVELALSQGFVLTHRQAGLLGVPAATVRRLLRRGAWSAPRYGVISPLPAESGCSTEVAAAAAALAWPETVISHASAAAVHCLPLLAPAGPPTLSADCWHRACTRDDIHMRISALFGDDFDDWFGAAVTSIERTIIDLARMRGVGQGLVAADAALHERLTTPARLRQTLLRQTGWPGVRDARRAVQLADGRSESPLESVARLCLADGGLPLPDLQVRVDTAGGPYRVDMLYRKQRVIIELDGLLKYRNDPRALVAEKRRQEHLERAGYRVIRLLWEDVLHRPAETLARVRAALAGR